MALSDSPPPPIGGVLCCGNLVADILVRPVGQPAWGATSWVESIEQHPGGNGANTSFGLARLGIPVRLLSVAGLDSFGDSVLSTLRAEGVDVSHVARSALPTAASVGLIDPQGARALLHRPGASRDASRLAVHFAPEIIRGCSRFHLANIFGLPGLRPRAAGILEQARLAGLSTSLDTGWDALGEWRNLLEPCLRYVDLLFVNQDESRMLSGTGDQEAASAIFRQWGAQQVVVKLGPAGCAVFTSEDQFVSPAFPVTAVDSTGAGDCFVAGFLAALQRGFTDRQAACFANAVGALSVRKVGATAGLLPFEDTCSWMRTHAPPSPA